MIATEQLLLPRVWTVQTRPEEKKKLPAVGAIKHFTILRIGGNNVKEEILCER
jgi:hypothetical protein